MGIFSAETGIKFDKMKFKKMEVEQKFDSHFVVLSVR